MRGHDYGNSNLVSYYTFPNNTVNSYSYDSFDRLTMKKYHNIAYYSQYRYYEPTGTATSSLVRLQYNNYNGGTSKYDYTYDILGNITSVSENNVLKLSYEYDSLGQLVRENNAYANKTWKYYYDNAGNITMRDEYAYTTGTLPASPQSFVFYDYSTGTWGDMLTSYNGTTISYDAIGNPLNWRNATSLTWSGRKLTRQDISSTSSVTYGYNADGIRVSKSYNSSSDMVSRSYQYILDGTNVIYEKQQTVAQFGGDTNELYYYYDESGVAGFELNGVTYYYLKNIQGDVINILNSSGQVVVTYSYDAWGKVLSVTGTLASTVGQINPFRYRGYYYDTETGFYYLQTRYYDPEVGRFLNADGYVSTGQGILGNNMFAYCGNNPVMFCDPNGDFFISVLAVCIIGGAAICGTAGGIIANEYAKSKGYTGADKARCIAVGIFGGGLFGGLLGYVAAPAVVSATGVAGISITSGIAVLGTSFGKLGTLIENDGQQIIDWSKTTCHGIQRMLERGVTQDMVEAWAKTGKALQQAGDKILYITKLGAVVIDKAGKVITAYTSQDFDPAMQEVIKKLFGK